MDIPVCLGERSYHIRLGRDCLTELSLALEGLGLSKSCVLITHPTIYDLYGQSLVGGLKKADYSVIEISVPEGETSKSLDWASTIYPTLLEKGCDRSSFVIALGGGVIGDLAGFVAGTYMRGIPFIQVPTTLLAQVDASIGGKVAVDLPKGKNLVGLFYQPSLVFIDIGTLKSLAMRELISGFAEVIKYGCICDGELFQFLEDKCEQLKKLDMNALEFVIERSCKAKAGVVEEDEKESGLRAILNYGHTVGHAIESAMCYQGLLHGEAIAIGMRAAAMISHKMGFLSQEDMLRQEKILCQFGLPQSYSVDPAHVSTYLMSDKKRRGTTLRWVLLKKIGEVFVSDEVSSELVDEVLEELYTTPI